MTTRSNNRKGNKKMETKEIIEAKEWQPPATDPGLEAKGAEGWAIGENPLIGVPYLLIKLGVGKVWRHHQARKQAKQ